jgi:mgtE-like transporter
MPRARRGSRLVAALRSERRTLRQGVVALVLSTAAGFVAGLTLSHITGSLERLPSLLVLIPAAVGMRGTIFGAMASRLGTSIHAGIFRTTLRGPGVLGDNVTVAVVTTFTSSLWLAVLAKLAATVFGDPSISIVQLLVISVVGGALGSVAILGLTVALSIVSFRRGWDLDAVGMPMVTALGDAVTLPTLFLASLLVDDDLVTPLIAVTCVVAVAWSVAAALRSHRPDVRRIVVQMAAVIALTPLLDIAAGGLLGRFQTELVHDAGILILIPPFVSQAGAIGGILSSRLSSKLQLGVITPRGRPERPALADAAIVVTLGVIVFTMIGVIAAVLASVTGVARPAAGLMVAGTVFAGLLVLPVTVVVGYYVAVLTTRFGLDPDNHGVPTITATLDLTGVAAVLFVMSVLGVT